MEKGVDFDDSFSPTPGLAVDRFMLSLAVANDYELHACELIVLSAPLLEDALFSQALPFFFLRLYPIRTKASVSHNNASMWRAIFQQIYLIKDCIQWLARLHDLFKMTSGGGSRSGFFESLPLDGRRRCSSCFLLLFFASRTSGVYLRYDGTEGGLEAESQIGTP
jgi:hypothetical protein